MNIGLAFTFHEDSDLSHFIQEVEQIIPGQTIINDNGQTLHLTLFNASVETPDIFLSCLSGIQTPINEFLFEQCLQFESRNVLYFQPDDITLNVILDFHTELFAKINSICEVRPFYTPQKYTPHLSIAGGYNDSNRNILNSLSLDHQLKLKFKSFSIATWSGREVTTLKSWG